MESKKPYRDILDLYTSKDELRPGIMVPFFQEDKVFATDARIIICFESKLLEVRDFTPHPKHPDALRVIPSDENISINLPVGLIEKSIKKSNKVFADSYVRERIDCPDCKGSGWVTSVFTDYTSYEHNFDVECPVCEIDGKLEVTTMKSTGNLVDVVHELIQISDAYFNPVYLKTIRDTAKMLKLDSVRLTHKKNEASLFKFIVGVCTIGLMPIIKQDESEYTITKMY